MDDPVFTAVQPRLYAVALGVLGDPGDAEDVVQEAWLRWDRADRATVRHPPAFLAVTTSRLALNVTLSARRRHERPAGAWLPEPVDQGPGPETDAERREAVDVAIRVMLQRLSPAGRATYLLRTAFDYPYRRIAEVLHLGAGNARQLMRRAHRDLATGPRRPVDGATHRRLVRVFLAAARTGELGELERLLRMSLPRPERRP